MRKFHRTAHRKVWPLLGLIVGAGLVLALLLRPAPEGEAQGEGGSFTVLETSR